MTDKYKVVFELSTIDGKTKASGPVPGLQGMTKEKASEKAQRLNQLFELHDLAHINIGPEDLILYDIARDEPDAISQARQRLLGQHYRQPMKRGPSPFPFPRSNRDSKR
jgi:hypothetical protein